MFTVLARNLNDAATVLRFGKTVSLHLTSKIEKCLLELLSDNDFLMTQ